MSRNRFNRSATVGAVDVKARTVEVAFSSELPYERWFGIEILDHSPGSVDLSRLNDGTHPLLMDHDPLNQVGVIVSARIDPDRIGRAVLRLSKNEGGEALLRDMADGIRMQISVGYEINELEDGGERMAFAKFQAKRDKSDKEPVFRVTGWTPFEISSVSIAADPTVGVGRSISGGGRAKLSTNQQTKPPQQPIILKGHEKMAHENDALASEKERVSGLMALAEQYRKYTDDAMLREHISGGRSVQQMQEAIMAKMATRHSSAKDMEIGLTDQEVRGYSLSRAINAAINGDWSKAGFERAASDALAQRMGVSAQGFFVPLEAFGKRAFTASGNTGDNLIQSTVLGGEFVDVLRNKLVLSALGARIMGGLTGNVLIPRKATASTISTATEIAQFSATNPTTNQISMSPHRLGASIPYSKQSLIQASVDVEALLRDDLMAGIAVAIEAQALTGNGTAPNVRGLINQSGIGAVVGGTHGAQINWGHIVGLETATANANAIAGAQSGYLVNTKTRGWTKTNLRFPSATIPQGQTIWSELLPDAPLNSYRAEVSNVLPSNLDKGNSTGVCSALVFGADWSNLVLGLFGGLDIVVDPYSLADSGQVKLTANQYIDVAVRQPSAFAVMLDGLTA